MKKYTGFALWLIALLLPFRSSLLSTEGVSNLYGLFSFLAMLALFFAGYLLVDSSTPKPGEEHGH